MEEIQNIRPMREVALKGQKYFYCILTASDMQMNFE